MKFTDGYWVIREGVRANYAAQAYDAAAETGTDGVPKLVIHAPTHRVNHRGDTLGGVLLTVEYWSPLPDVIGVKLTHFAGEKPGLPRFELEKDLKPTGRAQVVGPTPADKLFAANSPVADASVGSAAADKGRTGTASAEPAAASFTSGELSVVVPLDAPAWRVEFRAGGRLLTSCDAKSSGYAETGDKAAAGADIRAGANGSAYMHEMLTLKPGDLVYGLGERFGAFVKNGQTVDSWNCDGGTASEQAYKNVPFYLTNAGYGVFVNHPGRVSFEVASEKVDRVQFSVAGEGLEYFVIYGPTPKDILRKYAALTGRPALPPAWAFGLWLSTSFTTSYDEATVNSFIDGMAERKIPLSVFHFDCFWMREYDWCDFHWDPRAFPDPAGLLRRLKGKGLKVCVWINPYIGQRSRLFAEAAAGGFLLKKADGGVWQTDAWQSGMGIIDFTNPGACRWYTDKLKRLIDLGVDCFKTDFGERIPTDVVYSDGSDPERMHNYYAYLYNKTVFELLETAKGRDQAVVFARSATAGSQKFPAHWGGDCESTYEAMAQSLRGGLSLALSGFGFWSHDIGGFEGLPRADIYKRWVAFGLLSPLSRLHGSWTYRVPWLFDEEAVDVTRFFTRLKNSLMPYLYARAAEAARDAVPMLRAMALEFPEDPACAYLDRQYLLGDRLLVAPVFSPEGRVAYYLPAGRWTNLLSGKTNDGPRWLDESHDFLSLPLLVRPGTLLARGAADDRPDYDYGDGVRLELFELADGATATAEISDQTGNNAATITATRRGPRLEIAVDGAARGWSLLLVNIRGARGLNGASAEETGRGTRLRPKAGAPGLVAEYPA